mmetsp:Transcript_3288/g.6478  ORF Transcript_3288/g.6478 Transcript_3288/m.6478 type:complete len:250 (-) Transcript_3288:260-1009(-)
MNTCKIVVASICLAVTVQGWRLSAHSQQVRSRPRGRTIPGVSMSDELASPDPTLSPLDSLLSSLPKSILPTFVQRDALKRELLELADKSRGGILPLDAAEQARLDEIITEQLPALNPTTEPARSNLFSGEWDCVWTTESELNFAVEKGLFGLPWQRTYQSIDVPAGSLTNVIQFDDGALTVGSTISPDEDGDGSRFKFEFEECSVRWRGLTVPLPPFGRGWGDLLYLDETMRIQRDIRGDLLVAQKKPS